MNLNVEKNFQEEYADNFTLIKEQMSIYNISATLEKIMDKLKGFKIARNKFINGYHVRLTPSYRSKLESFTGNVSAPVGNLIEYKLDNQQDYNEFNIQLNKLYSIMSKEESVIKKYHWLLSNGIFGLL